MEDKLDQLNDNLPEISVSELSNQVKFTVETAFGRVRVRGEISRPKKAASGHLYLTLKDDRSVIDGVCWKGNAQRLAVQPEEGMDVICTGRITTYPMQSKYQMVIEKIELAGEGALLKLLEERRKKLADEGLFDRDKKQSLPKFPKIIGVVTSPTGSVIRDIIHRIEDRFPLRVIIWPVLVQGNKAAEQIANGIEGFEKLKEIDPSLGPDVLIVARGGGSLEDLWPFNEENVVRAVFNNTIPLISAIGHETDTTLIDFVADVRAPTPTAAAELAVPVRSDLLSRVIENERRLLSSINRSLNDFKLKLEGFSRGLGDPDRIIEEIAQRFDQMGIQFLDAPVARTQQAAIDGNLSIMVGGNHDTLERYKDVLLCMGPDITHCGPVGCGQIAKILNNMVVFQNGLALAEAITIGREAGMDGGHLLDIINKSSGASFVGMNHGMKSMVPGKFPLKQFPARYALKDLSYALQLAEEGGVVVPGAELAGKMLEKAIDLGNGDEYWPTIIKAVENRKK